MRALIQRVSKASVNISGNRHSAIKNGLLIFTCWENDDDFSDSDWMLHKILNLRVFDDEKNVMNQSVQDIKGEILIVSQFPSCSDCMGFRSLFAGPRRVRRCGTHPYRSPVLSS